MVEEETTTDQPTTTPSTSRTGAPGHRRPVRDKFLALEGRWFMGRFAPRELLDVIDRHLRLQAPERREDLLDAIRARAEEIAEADKDLPVDSQSEDMLAFTSTILTAYEILLPIFDNDQRRTVLFLQRVVGEVARRHFEVAFEMRVHRCFFRDHFTRHGNPLLTTALCAWDANWMRAIDPAVSGLRAERTSLVSLGDDACRFGVLATDDPLASYTDRLNQRSDGKEPGRPVQPQGPPGSG
jgi:hypothetical protein